MQLGPADFPGFGIGELACPCVHRRRFPLYHRLKVTGAINMLVEKKLHAFQVSMQDHKAVLVYQTGSKYGHIFYMILTEVRGTEQCTTNTHGWGQSKMHLCSS
ncbi:unnamed protein product, partial [Discosporangium mesarthrocarpum]